MLEYNVNAAVKAMVSEIKHKDDEGNMDTWFVSLDLNGNIGI